MKPVTIPSFGNVDVKPKSPADSIVKSVRALNTILAQMSGPSALAALRAGDACANVDLDLWAPAWEGAQSFRDQFLLNLARMTRDEWRRDIADIVDKQPETNRPALIAKAMDCRIRISLDFAFKVMVRRQVSFLGDALMLAFEGDIPPDDFSKELLASAARCRNANPELLSALTLAGGAEVLPTSSVDSIVESVAMLNVILEQLSGPSALAALRAADAWANVDPEQWETAWKAARTFKDQFLLKLARRTRDEWRRDVVDITDKQPAVNRPAHTLRAMDCRIRITLEFAFRFMERRQVSLLGDALMLAFEADVRPAEFSKELAASASRCRNATPEKLSALVLGASGMHKYQPERLIADGNADSNIYG